MSDHLANLRQRHSQFFYRQAQWHVTPDGLELSFEFHTSPDLTFKPTILFAGVTQAEVDALSPGYLQNLVFSIGMVEMLSYWKTSCSPEIIIEAGPLSPAQIEWWHNLLINGMGEFFFVNDIDFSLPDFVTLRATDTTTATHNAAEKITQQRSQAVQKAMIPIGGGKDSLVSLELLKKSFDHDQLACLLINPTQAALEIAQASQLKVFQIKRTLDPLLFELNRQGYLNGHTPFSALAAFLTVTGAALKGYSHVVISNEQSSNEGSVWFHDKYVNHQYSKSFPFERSFQLYVNQYLLNPTTQETPFYFSFLRPLFELQIARLFSQSPEWFSTFRSCNRGQKTNSWCGNCPKCLFAYAILFPFIPTETMISIFGQDLFDKLELWPIAQELLGAVPQKPLECVGTHEENLAAFYLSAKRYQDAGQELPALLKKVHAEILSPESHLDHRAEAVLSNWSTENHLPSTFENILKQAVS